MPRKPSPQNLLEMARDKDEENRRADFYDFGEHVPAGEAYRERLLREEVKALAAKRKRNRGSSQTARKKPPDK